MRIVYVTEGDRDEPLAAAIISRVGSNAVNDRFPVYPDSIEPYYSRRRRGFGGVQDSLAKLRNYIVEGRRHPDLLEGIPVFDLVVAVVDDGARNKERCRVLVKDLDGVFGVSIEEFEAWVLGDLGSLKAFLDLDDAEVAEVLDPAYRPEQDKHPKVTLDRLKAMVSPFPWDSVDSLTLADEWRQTLDVEALGNACPKGFRPFAEWLRHRIQAVAGLLPL